MDMNLVIVKKDELEEVVKGVDYLVRKVKKAERNNKFLCLVAMGLVVCVVSLANKENKAKGE